MDVSSPQRAARRLEIGFAHCLLTGAVCACMLLQGCGKSTEPPGAGPPKKSSGTTALPYPSTLSAKSTPKEVAAVLIGALDAGDKKILLCLVAVKAGGQEIEAIFRKHGRSKTAKPGTVAALAVAGWSATYSFCRKGETQVKREEIKGDKALVFADCKARDGKPRTLEITLFREDGLWKVRPGLGNLPRSP